MLRTVPFDVRRTVIGPSPAGELKRVVLAVARRSRRPPARSTPTGSEARYVDRQIGMSAKDCSTSRSTSRLGRDPLLAPRVRAASGKTRFATTPSTR